MRCLQRNKVQVSYANYTGKSKVLDSESRFTGEYTFTYDTPVTIMANVSEATGIVLESPFGIREDYDKVIVYDDPNLDIAETSVLWVDTQDTDDPYDYVVGKIARSLNSITISIKKVDVDA